MASPHAWNCNKQHNILGEIPPTKQSANGDNFRTSNYLAKFVGCTFQHPSKIRHNTVKLHPAKCAHQSFEATNPLTQALGSNKSSHKGFLRSRPNLAPVKPVNRAKQRITTVLYVKREVKKTITSQFQETTIILKSKHKNSKEQHPLAQACANSSGAKVGFNLPRRGGPE